MIKRFAILLSVLLLFSGCVGTKSINVSKKEVIPDNIRVLVWLENDRVIKSKILDYDKSFGRFYYFETVRKKRIDRFRNDKFPNCIWETKYPKNANGRYILVMRLAVCYDDF